MEIKETKGKPLCAPFVLLFWNNDAGSGSMLHVKLHQKAPVCSRGWPVPLHEMASLHISSHDMWNEFKNSSLSFADLAEADVKPFRIIQRAFFDPSCQLSQKHIFWIYKHFYRHTWKLRHKGHKLKYYECYKSARHLSELPNKSPVEYLGS